MFTYYSVWLRVDFTMRGHKGIGSDVTAEDG